MNNDNFKFNDNNGPAAKSNNNNLSKLNNNISAHNKNNTSSIGTNSFLYSAILMFVASIVAFRMMVVIDPPKYVLLIGILLLIGSMIIFGYFAMQSVGPAMNRVTLISMGVIMLVMCIMSYYIGSEMNVSGVGFMVTVLLCVLSIMTLNLIGDKYNRLITGSLLAIGALFTWTTFMYINPV